MLDIQIRLFPTLELSYLDFKSSSKRVTNHQQPMGMVWIFQSYSLSCWAGLIWGKPDLNELSYLFAYEVVAHWLFSNFSEMLASCGHTPTRCQSWRPGHGRVSVGQCNMAQHLTPGAPNATWTPELEGCQQSLDIGEYFWCSPGGNAMCPTSNVGLQPFLFGS